MKQFIKANAIICTLNLIAIIGFSIAIFYGEYIDAKLWGVILMAVICASFAALPFLK